jgi:RecJ-like exonuclease
MTDQETQMLYEILAKIVGTTISVIDALDETVLALISTHQKLNQGGQAKDGEAISDESLEVDEALAEMEFSEAYTEYEQKRWEFQTHLQHLRQIHNKLRGLPVSRGDDYVEVIKEECDKKLQKGL